MMTGLSVIPPPSLTPKVQAAPA